MKPPVEGAFEGRINPKGIPCLYLATTRETAMSEVRPWIGAYVSAGQFLVRRNLKLVDCSLHDRVSTVYLKEPPPAKREAAVWARIDASFSKPVTNDQKSAEYAPTQVLGELFKDMGFDGVVYRSAVAQGYNVALFDLDDAYLTSCHLHRVGELNYSFEQDEGASYYVREHYVVTDEPGDAKSGAPRTDA